MTSETLHVNRAVHQSASGIIDSTTDRNFVNRLPLVGDWCLLDRLTEWHMGWRTDRLLYVTSRPFPRLWTLHRPTSWLQLSLFRMVYREIYRVRQKYYYSTTIYFLRPATSLVLNTHNNITEKSRKPWRWTFPLDFLPPDIPLDISPPWTFLPLHFFTVHCNRPFNIFYLKQPILKNAKD